ncbi:MAG: ATPase [Gammaproteobacteria bacterium]|nr:ATPase [Gammaproteobacteria bacterium]
MITNADIHTWKPLRLLNLYRLIIASLFAVLFNFSVAPGFLGKTNPALFEFVSLAYLTFALASVLTIRRHRPAFPVQVYTQVLGDILAITLLMHASGGVHSGLGTLLVVAVAAGSILMAGRMAILFAAIASLAALIEQIYAQFNHLFEPIDYTQTGILGATFFATAILMHVLARRIRESEALAVQRGVDLANMTQLNEYIIQHMRSGILVVDKDNRVRLLNQSAWYLLGMPGNSQLRPLGGIAPELAEQLASWRRDPTAPPRPFRLSATASDTLPRFAPLGTDAKAGTVIFLDDSAVVTQQAQQMKLASLGRLAASIAHEIRNPLGAISHAGQLLRESPALDKSERRLTDIIHEQSQRMNTIVENILQLSRRERSQPEDFALRPWMESFVAEFARDEKIEPAQINLDVQPPDAPVRFDPSQLRQVLWNLCQNGLRHGGSARLTPKLELRGGATRESGGPFLDVIDSGPGISPAVAQHLFEPFFTTDPKGTGLGLYIARELCECNQARLTYLAIPAGGSCFRISFFDPGRRVL